MAFEKACPDSEQEVIFARYLPRSPVLEVTPASPGLSANRKERVRTASEIDDFPIIISIPRRGTTRDHVAVLYFGIATYRRQFPQKLASAEAFLGCAWRGREA
jgi:hypothetical protein